MVVDNKEGASVSPTPNEGDDWSGVEVAKCRLGVEAWPRAVWVVAVESVETFVVSAERDVLWLMLRVEVRKG